MADNTTGNAEQRRELEKAMQAELAGGTGIRALSHVEMLLRARRLTLKPCDVKTAAASGEVVQMDELAEAIHETLRVAVTNGFELPLHVAVIGCNGSFVTALHTPQRTAR